MIVSLKQMLKVEKSCIKVHNNFMVKYVIVLHYIASFYKAFFICTDFKLKLFTMCKCISLNERRRFEVHNTIHNYSIVTVQTRRSILAEVDLLVCQPCVFLLLTSIHIILLISAHFSDELQFDPHESIFTSV